MKYSRHERHVHLFDLRISLPMCLSHYSISDMNVIKNAEDVLKAIETALIAVSQGHPDMTNYTAMRVYEAAIAHYHDLARQQQPKPVNLNGLDAIAYKAVQEACESR